MQTCETCRWFFTDEAIHFPHIGDCRITLPPMVPVDEHWGAATTLKSRGCSLHQPKESTDATNG